MGRPSSATTARQMGASGTRSATLPVLAVTRRGSLLPAFTTMVRGPARSFRRACRSRVDRAGKLVGLGDVGDEQREWLVTGAGLQVVDVVDRAQVHGIDREAVEGVGWQGDNLAAVAAVGHVGDQCGLRLVRMYAKHLSVQRVYRSSAVRVSHRGCGSC